MRKPVFILRSEKPLFHTVPRSVQWGVGLSLLIYALACSVLFFQQRALIFHPPQAPVHDFSLAGSASEGPYRFWISAPAPASPLHSLCPKGPHGRQGAVAYFGGNAEQASSFSSHSGQLPGCALYALIYPGYEGASGAPTEESIHASADAMLARMERDGVDLSASIFFGRSLGSGEAVRQASLHACALAVLATPYESLLEVSIEKFPWAPVWLLLRDRFDARPWAAAANCPALILYADTDPVIAPHHALALRQWWNPKQSTETSSNNLATHANILDIPGTWSSIEASALAVLQKSAAPS